MSPRFLRHSWLAIAAPFFAGSIIRAADSHWQSALVLSGIGVILVSVELFIVLRIRVRNPFYRLKDFKTDRAEVARELSHISVQLSGYAEALNQACVLLSSVLNQEVDMVAGSANIAAKRQLRKTIRERELDMCKLMSEFRGFFYVSD